jgi:hypothetical protein
MPICKICGEDVENRHLFSRIHLKKVHKIGPQEYFDKYIKNPGDGICKHQDCNNPTAFKDLTCGYGDFCSRKCLTTSDLRKERIKSTSIKKYGCSHPMQNNDVKEKLKSVNLEKYGVTSPAKSEAVRQKMKTTMINRYGVDHPMHVPEQKQKMIDTNMEKYGTNCVFKSEVVKSKIRASNKEKLGTDYPLQNKECQEKARKTMLARYGGNNWTSPELRKKTIETNLARYGSIGCMGSAEVHAKFIKTQRGNKWGRFVTGLNNKKLTPLFDVNYYSDVINKTFKYHCSECNIDFITEKVKLQKINCPHKNFRSEPEKYIQSFIKCIGFEFVQSNVRPGDKYEIDVFIPAMKFGIEYHGLYWHSDVQQNRRYHSFKYHYFAKKGIYLMQIFEDEWLNKPECVKDHIRRRLGKCETQIRSQSCEVIEISDVVANSFHDRYNVLGVGDLTATIHYGLDFRDELIAVMSFMETVDSHVIVRYTPLHNTVVEGSAKVLYQEYVDSRQATHITFCDDLRYSNTEIIESLELSEVSLIEPKHYYFKNRNSQLGRISEMYIDKEFIYSECSKYDETLDLHTNLENNNYLGIYDAGFRLYVKPT